MDTFTWLFLGHLVGDWMLQNDWMARNKQNHLFTAAGMAHFIVYTACIVVALLFIAPQLPTPLLAQIALIVFISHWIIDATNLAKLWGKIVQQSDILMVRIMVDQCFHLLVLAFITFYFL